MTSKQFPNETRQFKRIRTLKIEEEGDAWRNSIRPKIRLMGRWLEMAGFKAGQRVQVVCTGPGTIELCCMLPSQPAAPSPSLTQENLAFNDLPAL
jgi:uncharacterized protein (AIM24 family)